MQPKPLFRLVKIIDHMQAAEIGKRCLVREIGLPLARRDIQRTVSDQPQHFQRFLDLGLDMFMELIGHVDQILFCTLAGLLVNVHGFDDEYPGQSQNDYAEQPPHKPVAPAFCKF